MVRGWRKKVEGSTPSRNVTMTTVSAVGEGDSMASLSRSRMELEVTRTAERNGRDSPMDWIHCNNCAITTNAKVPFYLTACSHILCKKCARKDGNATPGKINQCRICSTETRFLEINQSLPPHLRMYFLPIQEVANKLMNELKTVIPFQEKQRQLHLKSKQEKFRKATQFLQSAKESMKERAEQEKKWLAEKEELKAELTRTLNAIDGLERKIDESKRKRDVLTKSPKSPRRTAPSLNGNTPLGPLSFANIAHSTPLDFLNTERNNNVRPRVPSILDIEESLNSPASRSEGGGRFLTARSNLEKRSTQPWSDLKKGSLRRAVPSTAEDPVNFWLG